jgi:hypothetical protein
MLSSSSFYISLSISSDLPAAIKLFSCYSLIWFCLLFYVNIYIYFFFFLLKNQLSPICNYLLILGAVVNYKMQKSTWRRKNFLCNYLEKFFSLSHCLLHSNFFFTLLLRKIILILLNNRFTLIIFKQLFFLLWII